MRIPPSYSSSRSQDSLVKMEGIIQFRAHPYAKHIANLSWPKLMLISDLICYWEVTSFINSRGIKILKISRFSCKNGDN